MSNTGTDVRIRIDSQAQIHIDTGRGPATLAIVLADGTLYDSPTLSAQLQDALVDALLDELTPTLKRVSRPLSPSEPVPRSRQRPAQRRRAKTQSAG